MTTLRIETSKDGEEWSQVGKINPGDRFGSVSDQHDDGSSDIYVFGVDPVVNVGVINRSIVGMDVEIGGGREVNSLGYEPVARLDPGQYHEMLIKTRSSPKALLVRFAFDDV